MQRRDVLQVLTGAALWPGKVWAAQGESYADQEAADRWMRNWMNGPKSSTGVLSVERFADRYYYLVKKIKWSPDEPNSPLPSVTVPVGFVTDFASIPQIAWSLFPPDGRYTYPAVMHDYLYWEQQTTRAQADEIFRLMMREFSVAAPAIATIYAGVRAGGGVAWEGNARLKESGEQRILRVFPDDPKTTWSMWKTRDVF